MGEVKLKGGQDVNIKPVKKKHYWWRYLLTFIGGFLFCIGAIAGGVAITGTVITVKDIVTMTGNDPNEYIGIKYQNESVLSLVQKLMSNQFETLGDINEVTPIVKKTVEETLNPVIQENLKYSFDWDELKTKPFTLNASSPRSDEEYDHTISLGDYIPKALMDGVTLASFVVGDSDPNDLSGILKLFLYKTKTVGTEEVYDFDNPYSIADILGDSNFFQNKIDNVTIGDVLGDVSGNPFLSQMASWKMSDFTDEKIKTLKIGILFTEEERNGNPLLSTLYNKDWTIADLSDMDNLNNLKISEIIDTSTADGLIKSIENNTIADLQSPGFVDGLYLKDIFDSPTGILGVMADLDYTVGDLNDESKILDLTVANVFDGISEGDLLYNFKDYKLSELSTIDISEIKLTDIYSVSDINANSFLKAIYDNNNDVTIGDLSDPATINGIELSAVVDAGTNKVLQSLMAMTSPKTTIGNLASQVNSLTLADVIEVPDDPTDMMYKIVHSDALSGVTINNIGSAFPNLKISDVMEIDDTDPSTPQILITMKENGTTITGLSTLMNGLTIKDVMNVVPGDMYLDNSIVPNGVYIRQSGEWVEVTDSTQKSQELSDYLTETTGYEDRNKAVVFRESGVPTASTHTEAVDRDPMYGVRDVNINNSNAIIDGMKSSLRLKDVISIDDESIEILKSLKDTKLNELSTSIQSLTLGQVVSITSTSPKILQALQNVQVFGSGTNNLEYALSHLMFSDYFSESDCSSGIMKVIWDSETDPVTGEGGHFLISDISSKINSLKLVDILEDKIYVDPVETWDGHKKIRSTWWFLLTEDGETFDGTGEKEYYTLKKGALYTVNDMDKLVANMEYHMSTESIFALIDAGFITVDSATMVKLNLYKPGTTTKYGELSISEFLAELATNL